MLNMNGKSRHYCLVPNIREKIFSPLSWCLILADFLFLLNRSSLSSWSIFPFLNFLETLITSHVRFFSNILPPCQNSQSQMETMDTAPSWLSDTWWAWHPEGGSSSKGRARWQSPCVATITGIQGREGVIVHKCLYSHRFVFGLRMRCTNFFSQKWPVSGCQQSYSEKPFSHSVSFLTPPSRQCSPVAHSYHPLLLVFPQVHLSQHPQASSVRFFNPLQAGPLPKFTGDLG